MQSTQQMRRCATAVLSRHQTSSDVRQPSRIRRTCGRIRILQRRRGRNQKAHWVMQATIGLRAMGATRRKAAGKAVRRPDRGRCRKTRTPPKAAHLLREGVGRMAWVDRRPVPAAVTQPDPEVGIRARPHPMSRGTPRSGRDRLSRLCTLSMRARCRTPTVTCSAIILTVVNPAGRGIASSRLPDLAETIHEAMRRVVRPDSHTRRNSLPELTTGLVVERMGKM